MIQLSDADEYDVRIAIDSMIDDYKKSVNAPLKASVSAPINQKHWEDLVTIKKIQFNDYFIVNSKPSSVLIHANWNLNLDHWAIMIHLSPFINSPAKRLEAYANLAEKLNLPYQQDDGCIYVVVEENEIQPIVERIITTLCG